MVVRYESIVPWGRSYEEYVRMFMLDENDLNKPILGCGDGPASFNCVMTRNANQVISVDPVYQFTREQIQKRINETCEEVIGQMRENTDKFVWSEIIDIDHLKRIRMAAMNEFLSDYDKGKSENRYIAAELPVLPFENDTFWLALSSHFLFLYSDKLSLDFHINAIDEMLRVAQEARIYPLVDLNAVRSPFVEKVKHRYSNSGYFVAEQKVDYEFQKGADTMLLINRQPS